MSEQWQEATLDAGWCVGPVIHGGYLLALGTAALSEQLGPKGCPDPVTVTGHFLSGARPGPVSTGVEVLRAGQALAFATARMCQPGGERLRVTAVMGDLAAMDGEARTFAEPPVLPPPERCFGNEDTPSEVLAQVPMLHRLDLRMDPETAGFAVGRPSGRGLIRGWMRFLDGREPTAVMLPLVADVLPPATLDLGSPGWTRTVEMTVHVQHAPAPGWLRVQHAARTIAGGYVEQDAEIWDSTDRLVARGRQLAKLAPVRGGAR